MKLGSLFSGSGGFELAGALNGIEPVWNSEIEPYPVRVTDARFPNCKQLGDVTQINGAEVEPVDIITFGSPCQDLSVAGKQAGIHKGERSNLFFEAIRIIKEMRDATDGKYPRAAIWENVPGAFSSNGGSDFQAVLQAFCDIEGLGLDTVPQPKKWEHAGCIVGDGYSVAWRLYDAQYWGVPQRRKRIYLVADFAGERAGEILFKPESVCWDSAESGKTREGSSTDAEGSIGRSNCAVGCDMYNGALTGDVAATLTIGYHNGPGHSGPSVCYSLQGGGVTSQNSQGSGVGENVSFTLNATDCHGVCYAIDQQGGKGGANYQKDVMPTLCSDSHGTPHAICCLNDQGGSFMGWSSKNAATLRAQEHGHQPVIAFEPGIMQRLGREPNIDVTPTLRANAGDNKPVVCFQQNQRDEVRSLGNKAGAITASPGMKNQNYLCFAPDRNYCSGYEESETSATLQTGYHYGSGGNAALAVYPVENHPNDSRVNISKDGIVQTLSSRMGTGGGNVPMVLEKTDCYPKVTGALCANSHPGSYTGQDAFNDMLPVIKTNGSRKYIVRRLTPLECCRLQGFPDWWTDGVEGSDSAVYKMWGNGIALPCAVDVLGRIANFFTNEVACCESKEEK